MEVVYSSSDSYAHIAGVSIASLLENNKDINTITIYVIDEGITESNKTRLFDIAKNYDRNLVFISKPDFNELLSTSINVGKWHISTFYRLFLHLILPKEVKRVIYLDCDVIVRGSLEELWQQDMSGYSVCAVDDFRSKLYRRDIGIDSNAIYTNNGVMVIDVEKWRSQTIEKEFIAYISKKNGDITYVDQGVLNAVLQKKNEVKLLPLKYNVQTVFYDLGYEWLLYTRQPLVFYSSEEIAEAIDNPRIVHFTSCFISGDRPWHSTNQHRYKDEYLHYRNLTPWRNDDLLDFPSSLKRKLLELIFKTTPKSVYLFLVRILHVYLYPLKRVVLNGGKR